MLGVVNLDDTPWVAADADQLATDFNLLIGTDDAEGKHGAELGVVLDGLFVVFLDIVRKVVDRNVVVFNVLHDALLEGSQLGGCEGVSLANDRDHVDAGAEASHKFDVDFAQRVAGGSDKVDQSMNAVVSEAGVSLDARLFGKNVVVLALEVADNVLEAGSSARVSSSCNLFFVNQLVY